jgi:hypothetical protein
VCREIKKRLTNGAVVLGIVVMAVQAQQGAKVEILQMEHMDVGE